MSQPLTKAEAERLAFLAEECAEVVQAVAKVLRHGWVAVDYSVDPSRRYDNRWALTQELGDLVAAMRLLCRARDIEKADAEVRAELKLREAGRYLHHQPREVLG